MYLTNEQKVVCEARIKNGYEFIGKYENAGVDGVQGYTIGLIKGRHRVHINALGYDSYMPGLSYQEVK